MKKIDGALSVFTKRKQEIIIVKSTATAIDFVIRRNATRRLPVQTSAQTTLTARTRSDMTKAAHPLANKIPNYMIGIFCEPILLKGEDPALYWNMVSAMIEEMKPATFDDWVTLHEQAVKLWEERVFRNATLGIIRGGQHLAVKQFLEEIIPGDKRIRLAEDGPQPRASKFFSDKNKEREDVHFQLAKYGITEAELFARSAQNNSDAILMFEGMVRSRESSRRKLMKDMKKRRSCQEVETKLRSDVDRRHEEQFGSCQEGQPSSNRNPHGHHHDPHQYPHYDHHHDPHKDPHHALEDATAELVAESEFISLPVIGPCPDGRAH